jgi:hypothetical protein
LGILLGFAPFILFALLMSVSVSLALWAAFAAAFAIGIRDFAHSKTLRMLDVGSAILFGGLALYTGFIQPSLSLQAVRLVVDGGLFAIAILSIVLRNPFTLAYAREQVPSALWATPLFIRTNYIISAVWALAFAIMALADAMATANQALPLSLDVAAGLAALGLAIIFTVRYPAYVRERAARATTN